MDLQVISQIVGAQDPNIYQPSIPSEGVRRLAARRASGGGLGGGEARPAVAAIPGRRGPSDGDDAGDDGPARSAERRHTHATEPRETRGPGVEREGVRGGRRRRRVTLPDAASATDLRRVRGGSMAMFIDTIVTRATQLPAADRQLLLSVYRDGQSVTSIALAACAGSEEACRVAARRGAREERETADASESRHASKATDAHEARHARGHALEQGDSRAARTPSPASLLARTLRRRVRLLASRLMEPKFVFVMREMRDWPTARRAVAEAVVLHGLSLREAAAALSMSLHAVRREHAAVHALFTARDG